MANCEQLVGLLQLALDPLGQTVFTQDRVIIDDGDELVYRLFTDVTSHFIYWHGVFISS